MDEFLSRVALAEPIGALMERVAEDYRLGKITRWKFIKEGYEELNIKLVTARHRVVLTSSHE
jgi:hypothetical protein